MHDQQKERWRELCEQAIREHDLEKMLCLIEEVNRLLEQKEKQQSDREGVGS